MRQLRIAIIGGGTAGCGACRRAAELGASEVTLIEKSSLASGSSGRSAGVYNLQVLNPIDMRIRIRARELFFRLNDEDKLPLAKIGYLRVAKSEKDLARFAEAQRFQKSLGAHDARLLTRAEIQKLVPDLSVADIAGALYGPNDGHLDGHILCNAIVDEARSMGARVMLNTKVTGYERRRAGHLLTTDKGALECDVVINAAGAWARQVGAMLGHAAPVNPQVHEVVRVRLPRKLSYTIPMVNFYVPDTEGEAIYFRQDGEDSLISGLHTTLALEGLDVTDPDNYSPPDGDAYLEEIAKQVSERLLVEDLGFKYGWYGLYPLSADGIFQVGPYQADPTVLVVAGMGGIGVVSGTILGALAAEWAVLGKGQIIDGAEALLPDRPTLAGR
ncbi:MAG: NAD(P)/FAD-dependent oxidoreductase [Reyranellaceae bacterium]